MFVGLGRNGTLTRMIALEAEFHTEMWPRRDYHRYLRIMESPAQRSLGNHVIQRDQNPAERKGLGKMEDPETWSQEAGAD